MTIPGGTIFWEDGDTVFCVRNWRKRRSEDVTPLLVKLSEGQASIYGVGRLEGRSEQEIFDELFAPPQRPRTARIEKKPATARFESGTSRLKRGTGRIAKPAPIEGDQVMTMIRELSGEKMPYLSKLSPSELSDLYQILLRLKMPFA